MCQYGLKRPYSFVRAHLGVPSPDENTLHSDAREMMRKSGQRKAAIVNKGITRIVHPYKLYQYVGKDEFLTGTFKKIEGADK